MSWMKRRGQPSPSPAGVPLYNPNQHVQPQQWQPSSIPAASSASQGYPANNFYNPTQVPAPTHQAFAGAPVASQSAGYWQNPPMQPANQAMSYSQAGQPHHNANQYQPPTNMTNPSSQNVYPANVNYPQQQYYQHSGYSQQPQNNTAELPPQVNIYNSNTSQTMSQQNQPEIPAIGNNSNPGETDPWNWGWGDEPNSNTNPKVDAQNTMNLNFSTNVEDSFGIKDDTWNWSVDDSNSSSSASNSYKTDVKRQNIPSHSQSSKFVSDSFGRDDLKPEEDSAVFEKIGARAPKHRDSSRKDTGEQQQQQHTEDVSQYRNLENILEVAPSVVANNDVRQPENVVYLEQMPVAMTGRRGQSDTLTPQWSIESQISQDSSDDIIHTSESENRSNKLSRSSTISQCPSLPNSGQDFEVTTQYGQVAGSVSDSQLVKDDSQYTGAKQEIVEADLNNYESQGQVANIQSQIAEVGSAIENLTLQHNVFENKEIVAPELNNARLSNTDHYGINASAQQPAQTTTPPMLVKNITPPLMPSRNNLEGSQNPYKRTVGPMNLSGHIVRASPDVFGMPTPLSRPNEPPKNQLANNFVQQVNQGYDLRPPIRNLGVNLETVPDNAERPDQFPMEMPRQQLPANDPATIQHHQWQPIENLEIAPKNDRNQYLETGQLSDNDALDLNYHRNDVSGETNAEEPPPGLSRMVLGHTETDVSANTSASEPRILTGLDRVIDGEPEDVNASNSKIINNSMPFTANDDLAGGLHRMVPGESSSPESGSRRMFPVGGRRIRINNPEPDCQPFPHSNYDDDDTEAELQSMGDGHTFRTSQRSETIGADTPPTSASHGLVSSDVTTAPTINRDGAIGRDSFGSDTRETNVDGASMNTDSLPQNMMEPSSSSDNVRFEPRDGRAIESDIPSTARSQTDGENTTDKNSTPASNDAANRGRTRSDTSDEDHSTHDRSDRRRKKSPGRYDKERKYYDHDDRHNSPERYRDRRTDGRRPRNRYYEDDTDYYSDKDRRDRRPKDHKDSEDYDRRYSSMRRDMDRPEKHLDRDRREYDPRRDDYYYRGKYEEDYFGRESRGSRPSSRSDSYRDRDRINDHWGGHRKPRDPYNSYYQAYGYDAYNPYYNAHYQQHYQYYENLRRTNPAAYADWYRKYYQGVTGHGGPTSTATGGSTHDDRASVHSGRSSADDKDRILDNTDSSLNLEDTTTISQRMTPAKFTTAHVKGDISSGHLIRILPHYPLDGQPAVVEFLDLNSVLVDDPQQQELADFPGPFIKGVTHKKTVIEYCENKINKAIIAPGIHDRDSYILMWDLLILLLRQNGVVVGTDIAELLMNNASKTIKVESRPASVVSSVGSVHEESPPNEAFDSRASLISLSSAPRHKTSVTNRNETFVTNKFREYLIYGSGKEALEWAMKNGLWGHALFLASKLDKRTYANVMMRFANGLTINDPLQTLYQLLSGRQPAAVTCLSDEKWGDWRPHLAMILSNTSQRPDLNRKAITTLGDTLQARGSLYAAHFCYLMAQIGFGRYDSKSARLVLLGSSHQKSFTEFASNEAIIMTEVYEYACSLSDPTFSIPEFQPYKYLLACRLAERGFLERALLYTERVGVVIAQNPARHGRSLADQVLRLGERLRARDSAAFADIHLDPDDEDADNNAPNQSWITNLKAVLSDYDLGLITQDAQSMSNLASSELDITQSLTPPSDQVATQMPMQQTYDQLSCNQQPLQQISDQHEQQYYQQEVPQNQQQWSAESYQQQWQVDQQPSVGEHVMDGGAYQQQNDVQNQQWTKQQWNVDNQQAVMDQGGDVYGQQQHVEHEQVQQHHHDQQNFWPPLAQNEPEPVVEEKATDDEPAAQPTITMPNASGSNYAFPDDNDVHKSPIAAKETSAKVAHKQSSSSGWFGGIWNKISLRPKNQMKLPDDKNPSIVWDTGKKKWVNLDEDGEDVTADVKPPPKMSDLYPKMGLPPQSRLPVAEMNGAPPTMSLPSQVPVPLGNGPQPSPADRFPRANNAPIPAGIEGELPAKPPAPNMFKMQRGRAMKKAYVDVFNVGGTTAPSSLPPATSVFGPGSVPAKGANVNYFVPQPVNEPYVAPTEFSTASLHPDGTSECDNAAGAPALYNPNQFYSGQQ